MPPVFYYKYHINPIIQIDTIEYFALTLRLIYSKLKLVIITNTNNLQYLDGRSVL